MLRYDVSVIDIHHIQDRLVKETSSKGEIFPYTIEGGDEQEVNLSWGIQDCAGREQPPQVISEEENPENQYGGEKIEQQEQNVENK